MEGRSRWRREVGLRKGVGLDREVWDREKK
jgi:hypothetical protein